LILFTAEEPTRFGLGCIGSRALAGVLGEVTLPDAEGTTFEKARTSAGFTGAVAAAHLPRGHYHAFVELHIEQGPVLEGAGIPIGVVTAIAASATSEVSFAGDGGHAGTVPMHMRHDPLLAAAELALLAEATAEAHGRDAVATVGKLSVYPSASNSIPRRVQMSLDVRHVDEARRDAMVTALRAATTTIAARREVDATFQTLNADPAMPCAPLIIDATVKGADALNLPYHKLVSRAYHDTVFMGAICPVGMIFIPCYKGYSHRPEEFTTPQEIAQGVQVLALTLAELAEGTWRSS
jgi:hydantoinase/carbamoylase family amidase